MFQCFKGRFYVAADEGKHRVVGRIDLLAARTGQTVFGALDAGQPVNGCPYSTPIESGRKELAARGSCTGRFSIRSQAYRAGTITRSRVVLVGNVVGAHLGRQAA
ncbi:MAG: hypothetical protein ACC645_06580, partial [Pirellulales bacterium]